MSAVALGLTGLLFTAMVLGLLAVAATLAMHGVSVGSRSLVARLPAFLFVVIVLSLVAGLALMAVDARSVAPMGWVCALAVIAWQVILPRLEAEGGDGAGNPVAALGALLAGLGLVVLALLVIVLSRLL